MKISSKYKPELICSKDRTRGVLLDANVRLVKGKPALVATDGRRLVVVPVEAEEKEFGPVPKEAIQLARAKRQDKKQSVVKMILNGKIELENGWTLPRPKQEGLANYPNVDHVIPEERNTDMKICFNAKMLHELAQAMGVEVVTLKFQPNGAILVTAENEEAYGVLMPCRMS